MHGLRHKVMHNCIFSQFLKCMMYALCRVRTLFKMKSYGVAEVRSRGKKKPSKFLPLLQKNIF